MPLMILPPYYTPVQQAIAAALGFDPYFELVTFLSHFEGANNATTYVSTKGQKLTGSANAKLSTANKKFGTSALLSSSTQPSGMTVSSNLAANFLNNDFTIEAWIYTTATSPSANQAIVDAFTPGDGKGPFSFVITPAGYLAGHVRSGASVLSFGGTGTKVTPNEWHHVAFVRSGQSNLYVFLDGVQQATLAIGSVQLDAISTTPLTIGSNGNSYEGFDGYIDDVRITLGAARYKTNFATALPTAAFPDTFGKVDVDPWYDSVTCLINGETITEAKGKTITTSSVFQDSTNKMFGTGSLKSNGYMTVATTDPKDFQLRDEDFTVEAWIYLNGYQTINLVYHSGNSSSTGNTSLLLFVNASGALVVSTVATQLINSGNVPLNTWTHVAMTRSANVVSTWINGVLNSQNTSVNSSWTFTDSQCNVGGQNNQFGNMNIQGFRLTRGVCRYYSTFVPRPFLHPTTSFTTDSTYDPYMNNVVLQMRFDGTSGATTGFVDDTGKTVTNLGGAQIYATGADRDGTSGYFTNASANNGLSVPYSSDFAFGANDFTIEAWIRPAAFAGVQRAIVANWHPGQAANCAWLFNLNNGYLNFVVGMGGSNPGYTATVAVTQTNVWYHVAAVRHGRNLMMFLNGDLVYNGNVFAANAINAGDNPINIGNAANSGIPFLGYMDDIRITVGVARYTKKFTPSTYLPAPQTNSYDTKNASDAYKAQTVAHLSGDGAGITETTGRVKMSLPNANMLGIRAVPTPSFSNGAIGYGGFNQAYIKLTHATNLDLGTGDFTIETWARWTSGSAGTIIDMRPSSNGAYLLMGYDLTRGVYFHYNNAYQFTSPILVPNSWNHIALVRASGNVVLYVNGIQVGSTPIGTFANSQVAAIGADYSGNTPWNGQFDDFRITKGVARYTGPFDPSAV